jgi:hypothetical protein
MCAACEPELASVDAKTPPPTLGNRDLAHALHPNSGLCPRRQLQLRTGYLADYWYGAWWPQHQPVMPLVRVGLIKAIHVANMVKPQLPIESHWIAAGHPDSPESPFEVIVSRGDQQVSRLLLTPETPMPADLRFLEELADIWIVKRGPVGAWEVGEVGELGQRAVTTRLKAYPLKMPQARIRDGQQQYTSPQQYT